MPAWGNCRAVREAGSGRPSPGLGFVGCGFDRRDARPRVAQATPADPPPADPQKQFEEARRLRELTERRRGFAVAEFVEIDADGRVIVRVTNLTDKAIDSPFVMPKPDLIERLKSRPESVRFAFEARAITYADGTSEPDLDG